MSADQEQLKRVEDLGKLILSASEALERSEWQQCEKLLYQSARECRMILLAERQREREERLDRENREL